MALGDASLVKVDAALSDLFADWNLYTTIIATGLFFFLAYPWQTWTDPDTHPYLLARQATTSPVRQPGESAIYRSAEIPYGYPLRSGLNVKDPGAPKWSMGRNGDLRDIWIQAARGPLKDDGSVAGPKGYFVTVLGREKVTNRSFDTVTLEINTIGEYLRHANCARLAICLSNSIELIASLFAASFYQAHPILIPYGSPTDSFIQHIQKVQPDILIAESSSTELESLLLERHGLSQIILVTRPDSDRERVAKMLEDTSNKVKVTTWHDLVGKRRSSATSELPQVENGSPSPSLSVVDSSEGRDSTGVIEYSSQNIVAAVAAMINALPRSQRISSADVLLPIAPLTTSYPLILTFAALFSHAIVALNPAASEDVDLALAASGVSPTVIAVIPTTVMRYRDRILKTQQGLLHKLSRYWQSKSLLNGNMPTTPSFAPLDDKTKNRICHPSFAFRDLTDLRILLGARTCYALTTPSVAGAICQTNIFDYRQTHSQTRHPPAKPTATKSSHHFGPPLSSVEIFLSSDDDEKLSGSQPEGKITIRGPAVCGGGGEIMLDLRARIEVDHTLSLI